MVRTVRWASQGVLTSCLLLALGGCSEQDNPLGFEQGPRGAYVPAPVGFVAPDSADLAFLPERSTGAALSILVGVNSTGASPAESRGLIRFGAIPDTSLMRRAYLRLHVKRGEGDTIGIAIRRVLASWNPTTVHWVNQPEADSAHAIGTRDNVPTGTVSLTTPFQLEDIEIPMDLVRRWIAFPDSNYGFEIAPTHGDGMARIVSPNDVITNDLLNRIPSPALMLATDSTKTATRSALPTASAYVIRSLAPQPTGTDPTARVGAGPAERLLLRFDLSALPEGASIVRATLHLPLQSIQASTDAPLRFLAYEVKEAWSESQPPDTTGVAVNSTYDGRRDISSSTADVIDIEIGAMVQRWASGDKNYGMSIRLSDETFAPRSAYLYTREDPSHHPTLEVVYLPLPDPRFDGGVR